MDLDELARRWAPTHPRLTAALRKHDMHPEDDGDGQDLEDDPQDPEDLKTQNHRGVMVCLYPSPELAAAMALCQCDGECDCSTCPNCPDMPPGMKPEAADELHVTLAYLGKVGDGFEEAHSAPLVEAVGRWAKRQGAVRGVSSGIGVFSTPDGPATYASVDSPELPAARQDLVGELKAAGLPVVENHGFTPHMTLCWGDCRNIAIPSRELAFDAVSVVIGGNRVDIPLGVPSNDEDMSKLDSLGRPNAAVSVTEPVIAPADARTVAKQGDWSFVTTVGRKTVVTAAAAVSTTWGRPPSNNPHMLWIQGRFVGADVPNRNNAYWSSDDLEIGQPTVTHGPLNWLHEDRHIIGAIADSRFIPRRAGVEVAADTFDPHIVVAANVWRWVYPEEASVIEMASEAGALSISMECVAERIGCIGQGGCGREYAYTDYLLGNTCDHLQQASTVRRLINPTFLGGGIIVPPSRPGWADADMRVMASQQSEHAYEEAGRPPIPANDWEQIVAGAIRYATML